MTGGEMHHASTKKCCELTTEGERTLRIALAMRGGVSLAVWIGGAIAELDLFRRACNGLPRGDSSTDKRAELYRSLLKDTGRYREVEIDILAGASAGGLNAVLFGLAQSYDVMFDEIVRRTWITEGGIWELLREPGIGRISSILRGDDRLFEVARGALEEIADAATQVRPDASPVDSAVLKTKDNPTTVTIELAATLLDDQRDTERPNQARFSFVKSPGSLASRFSTIPSQCDNSRSDASAKTDHWPALDEQSEGPRGSDCVLHARPESTPPQTADGVKSGATWERRMALDRLALAARATSSFPGAFEPASIFSVPSGQGIPGTSAPLPPDYVLARTKGVSLWRPTAVNMSRVFLYSRSAAAQPDPFQVVDGGVFDNIPIDRAIRAIQRAPATRPSERVLIYLDPEPPKGPDAAGDTARRSTALNWIPVIRKSLALKQRAETEDDELALVREHNDAVRETAGHLEALAALMREGPEWRGHKRSDGKPRQRGLGWIDRAFDTRAKDFAAGLVNEETYLQYRITTDAARLGKLLTDPTSELCHPPREAEDYVRLPASQAVRIKDDLWEVYNHSVCAQQLSRDVLAVSDWVKVLIAWVRTLENLINDFNERDCDDAWPQLKDEDANLLTGVAQNLLPSCKKRLYRWLTVLMEAQHETVDEVMARPLRRDQYCPGRAYPLAEQVAISQGDQLSLRLTKSLAYALGDPRFSNCFREPVIDSEFYDLLAMPNRFRNPGNSLVDTAERTLDQLLTELRCATKPMVRGLPSLYASQGGQGCQGKQGAPDWLAYWCESVFVHFYREPFAALTVSQIARFFAVTGVPSTASAIKYTKITSDERPMISVGELEEAARVTILEGWLRDIPVNDAQLVRAMSDETGLVGSDAKLAGNALNRFAGFFQWSWRENDWQWGRMDAASGIARLLNQNRSSQLCPQGPEAAIKDLQSDIRDQSKVSETEWDTDPGRLPAPPFVASVGGQTLRSISPQYRFALASRMIPLLCRAVWPTKVNRFSMVGVLTRMGCVLLHPIVLPLPLVGDGLRLAVVIVAILGGSSLLGTGAVSEMTQHSFAVVFAGLGLLIAARSVQTWARRRKLRKRLRDINAEYSPPPDIEDIWVKPYLGNRGTIISRSLAGILSLAAVACAAALYFLTNVGEHLSTELLAGMTLAVIGAHHRVHRRHASVKRYVSSWQLRLPSGWRTVAAVAAILCFVAFVVVLPSVDESGSTETGARNLGSLFLTGAGVVGVLTATSLWGWIDQWRSAVAIVACATLGGWAQVELDDGAGSWDLLPVLVWLLTSSVLVMILRVRTENYGEPAIPKNLARRASCKRGEPRLTEMGRSARPPKRGMETSKSSI